MKGLNLPGTKMLISFIIPVYNEEERVGQAIEFLNKYLKAVSFDAEVIFLARKLGFSIKEIPINWVHETRDSKVMVLRDIFKSGWELIKIRVNDLKRLYS